MSLHPSVAARLERLAPDQRAAATAPPGPVLCIAPAGSGKTTTLVARIAWLITSGVDPATIAALTFNKRAAQELEERVAAALAPLDVAPGSVRVRTFHALGREILMGAGVPVEPLVERAALLRQIAPRAGPAGWRRLDDAFSRLKLDLGVTAEQVAADTGRGLGAAFVTYERALKATGGLDFDDLVVRALRLLQERADVLERWRRCAGHLLVDEVQDVDRSQLRLALLLAAPGNRVFFVGDDDQTIYAWRLADVRRVLGLAAQLPGLRRFDLVTNYRCPAPVVRRAVRLIEHNSERFQKRIEPRRDAGGRLLLAPDPGDEVARARRVLAALPRTTDARDAAPSTAVLARTNAELAPYAAVALERGLSYRAAEDGLLLDDPGLDELIAVAELGASASEGARAARGPVPLLVALGRLAARETGSGRRLARALLAWAPRYADFVALRSAVTAARERRSELRREDAALTLATAHGTKGLEFDHVVCVGHDEGRFPSARSIAEARDPGRVMEEERRLAYVAWTRARRSLVLIYDPAVPSPFLREAFTDEELRSPVPSATRRADRASGRAAPRPPAAAPPRRLAPRRDAVGRAADGSPRAGSRPG